MIKDRNAVMTVLKFTMLAFFLTSSAHFRSKAKKQQTPDQNTAPHQVKQANSVCPSRILSGRYGYVATALTAAAVAAAA